MGLASGLRHLPSATGAPAHPQWLVRIEVMPRLADAKLDGRTGARTPLLPAKL
jgi:hypothetical protein